MNERKTLIKKHQHINLKKETKISRSSWNTTTYAQKTIKKLNEQEALQENIQRLNDYIQLANKDIAWKKLDLKETPKKQTTPTPTTPTPTKPTPQDPSKQLPGAIEQPNQLPETPTLQTVAGTIRIEDKHATQEDLDTLSIQPRHLHNNQEITAYLQEHTELKDAQLSNNAITFAIKLPEQIRAELVVTTTHAQGISPEVYVRGDSLKNVQITLSPNTSTKLKNELDKKWGQTKKLFDKLVTKQGKQAASKLKDHYKALRLQYESAVDEANKSDTVKRFDKWVEDLVRSQENNSPPADEPTNPADQTTPTQEPENIILYPEYPREGTSGDELKQHITLKRYLENTEIYFLANREGGGTHSWFQFVIATYYRTNQGTTGWVTPAIAEQIGMAVKAQKTVEGTFSKVKQAITKQSTPKRTYKPLPGGEPEWNNNYLVVGSKNIRATRDKKAISVQFGVPTKQNTQQELIEEYGTNAALTKLLRANNQLASNELVTELVVAVDAYIVSDNNSNATEQDPHAQATVTITRPGST